MKLWRAAGRFTKLAGTDRIIHFEALPGHLLNGSTDLYEVVLFRRLRRALASGALSEVSATGASIYLLVGSVLHHLLSRRANRAEVLALANESFGPSLEALKLLEFGKPIKPISVHAYCRHGEFSRGFDVLHRQVEGLPTAVTVESVSHGQGKDVLPITRDGRPLVVVDLFKRSPHVLSEVLRAQFSRREQDEAPLLVIARVSREGGTPVDTVLGGSGALPAFEDIATWCRANGIHGSYLLLDDFDRDFFLPFQARYAVLILYATRDPEDRISDIGFRQIDQPETAPSTGLVVFERRPGDTSYEQSFGAELPDVGIEAEPDWTAWARERDWDPTVEVWTDGTHRFDGDLFTYHRVMGKKDVESRARTILSKDRDGSHVGPFGSVMIAKLLAKVDPKVAVFAIFRALDMVDCEPGQTAFLMHFLSNGKVPSQDPPTSLTPRSRDEEALSAALRVIDSDEFGRPGLSAPEIGVLAERAFGASSARAGLLVKILS